MNIKTEDKGNKDFHAKARAREDEVIRFMRLSAIDPTYYIIDRDLYLAKGKYNNIPDVWKSLLSNMVECTRIALVAIEDSKRPEVSEALDFIVEGFLRRMRTKTWDSTDNVLNVSIDGFLMLSIVKDMLVAILNKHDLEAAVPRWNLAFSMYDDMMSKMLPYVPDIQEGQALSIYESMATDYFVKG